MKLKYKAIRTIKSLGCIVGVLVVAVFLALICIGLSDKIDKSSLEYRNQKQQAENECNARKVDTKDHQLASFNFSQTFSIEGEMKGSGGGFLLGVGFGTATFEGTIKGETEEIYYAYWEHDGYYELIKIPVMGTKIVEEVKRKRALFRVEYHWYWIDTYGGTCDSHIERFLYIPQGTLIKEYKL